MTDGMAAAVSSGIITQGQAKAEMILRQMEDKRDFRLLDEIGGRKFAFKTMRAIRVLNPCNPIIADVPKSIKGGRLSRRPR